MASVEVAVAVAAVLVAVVLALLKARSAAASRRPVLDATQWKPLRLAERTELTHNTRLFR
jgi:outer membrane biogenesis lipoprotein LolB